MGGHQDAKFEVCHAHVVNMAQMCLHVGFGVHVSAQPFAPEALYDAHHGGAMTPAMPASMARWRRHELRMCLRVSQS